MIAIAFFSLGMIVGIGFQTFVMTKVVENLLLGSDVDVTIKFNETKLIEETYKRFGEGMLRNETQKS